MALPPPFTHLGLDLAAWTPVGAEGSVSTKCSSPGSVGRPFENSPGSKLSESRFNYCSRNVVGGRASFSWSQAQLTLIFLSPNR